MPKSEIRTNRHRRGGGTFWASGFLSVFGFLLCGFGTLTEKSGAKPHQCGSFLNGNFKVAAHTHAKNGQRCPEDLLALILELMQSAKHRANSLGEGRPWRHGHEPMDFQTRQGIEGLKVSEQLLGFITELAGFTDDVHFEQNGHRSGCLLSASV